PPAQAVRRWGSARRWRPRRRPGGPSQVPCAVASDGGAGPPCRLASWRRPWADPVTARRWSDHLNQLADLPLLSFLGCRCNPTVSALDRRLPVRRLRRDLRRDQHVGAAVVIPPL